VEGRKQLAKFLNDPDPTVRRAAVQWVGEERLREYQDKIAIAAAKEPVTRDLFEALLASQQMLGTATRKPTDEPSGEEYVARIVKDTKQPTVFRKLGLRMLRPDHPVLTKDLLKELLNSPERTLREETVHTLAMRSDDASQAMLRGLVADAGADAEVRSFAVLGLAQSAATSAETRRLLLTLLGDPALRRDALRSLRDSLNPDEQQTLFAWWDKLPSEKGKPSEERRELAEQLLLVLGPKVEKDRGKQLSEIIGPLPTDEAAWRNDLAEGGDAKAGERVFYHLRGPRCAVCHRIDGRGGQVGPDLSAIGSSSVRAKLIESILMPSKEIAPAYTNWILTLRDGKTLTGLILSENYDSTITFADADGKRTILKRLEVEERQASPKSLMPDNLHLLMTRREYRDLLAFLSATKQSP
jgi:putative heme-binding domain-containing protein